MSYPVILSIKDPLVTFPAKNFLTSQYTFLNGSPLSIGSQKNVIFFHNKSHNNSSLLPDFIHVSKNVLFTFSV